MYPNWGFGMKINHLATLIIECLLRHCLKIDPTPKKEKLLPPEKMKLKKLV
jgi:hypothetical protein